MQTCFMSTKKWLPKLLICGCVILPLIIFVALTATASLSYLTQGNQTQAQTQDKTRPPAKSSPLTRAQWWEATLTNWPMENSEFAPALPGYPAYLKRLSQNEMKGLMSLVINTPTGHMLMPDAMAPNQDDPIAMVFVTTLPPSKEGAAQWQAEHEALKQVLAQNPDIGRQIVLVPFDWRYLDEQKAQVLKSSEEISAIIQAINCAPVTSKPAPSTAPQADQSDQSSVPQIDPEYARRNVYCSDPEQVQDRVIANTYALKLGGFEPAAPGASTKTFLLSPGGWIGRVPEQSDPDTLEHIVSWLNHHLNLQEQN